MSVFNKQVGKPIDKIKEEKLRANWKKHKILTDSSFIGADVISELLNKPGAVGLRIYYGIDDDGNMAPIFFACDANGDPIVSQSQQSETNASTRVTSSDGINASVPCPPACGGNGQR
jgi:hypothetical protein